jgi:L-ascorbate metabolism protein UlaG (beta-lactamase superfamily)
VLLQLGGANILTDPVWSDRVGPVSWAGPRRVRPPGLRFEDLPPIDAVLVSHDHYDHLDLPTLLRLQEEHDPLFLTGLGNAALLRHEGIDRVLEMDWWEERRVTADVDVAFVPAQHFSGRGLCDQRASLWGGFVVRGPAGDAYFAGDTGYGIHFREIRERYGSPRLAVLPIGAFRPEWFMKPIHMGPAGALDAFAELEPTAAVAIHWDSFALGDDAQGEAVAELRRRLPGAELTEDDFWILEPGEGRDVP